MVNMRERQFQASLDVLCYKVARAVRIPFFQRFEYGAMSPVRKIQALILSTPSQRSESAGFS